jgi:hypothetical protein
MSYSTEPKSTNPEHRLWAESPKLWKVLYSGYVLYTDVAHTGYR